MHRLGPSHLGAAPTDRPATRRGHAAAGGVGLVLVCLVLGLVGLQPVASADGTTGKHGSHRVTVGSLTADRTVRPLGIDDLHPDLGWKLRSQVRGEHQTAYRVLVATSPTLLRVGRADIWDSGKVAGAGSVGVPYDGPALASATRYYWTVRVWGETGTPSAWSPTSWWETGLLRDGDWGDARWISPDVATRRSWDDFTLDADFTIESGAASFLFRAKDSSNFYMWQINTATNPGKVMLRPHSDVGGRFSNIAEIDLSPVLTPANADQQHHFRLRAEGSTFTTWIDGTQVDQRTDNALGAAGTLGFRSSSTGGIAEKAAYDNLQVHGLDGGSLFDDDFSSAPDPAFPQTPVVDGELVPPGGITLLSREAQAPVLRHSFQLDHRVASARAYVYGLGFYEMRLNGHKVGDRALTPRASQFGSRSLYDTYDVTDQMREGGNAVGLWLGNGYDGSYSQYAFRYLGPKKAIMLLRVTFEDGSQRDVVTDENGWSWSTDAITRNGIYAGESYDARRHQAWDQPGFDDSEWTPVSATSAPSDRLVTTTEPPVRVVRTLRPVALTEPRPGVWVFDLGQNISGWERLHVSGPAGTEVRMRTAEEVDHDGMLDTVTNRNAAATDTYTLAGTGSETYEPRFTYHGFRYVEVTGFPGTPTLDSLDGRVAHADVRSTGRFESSDPMLDRIRTMNRWAILNNSMSTPTDTPVRDERTPPAMDVQAYSGASTREFGMDAFYAKYLEDLPPGTALPTDDAKAQYPDMAGGQVDLAWRLFEEYGDRATLAAHYPQMKAFVDTNDAELPGHIWPGNRGFGDWCPPIHGDAANGGLGSPGAGDCFSEVSLVNTALSFRQAQEVAEAAAALDHPGEAAHYRELADEIKTAFNDHFLDDARDTYGDGRQTTSILPLALGMVPEANESAVGAQLVHTIMSEDGGHLDTGIFGTRYLVDALAVVGRMDVAMTVLDNRTYPGFGFELSQDATTPWEQWTYQAGMLTHDHAMFAGVNTSLYTRLAGILPAAPGYREVTVDPQVPEGLDHVAASIDTVRGRAASRWTRTSKRLTLDVRIPVNATATVHVPRLGGHRVLAPQGSRLLRESHDRAVYAVGSGRWTFVTKLTGR